MKTDNSSETTDEKARVSDTGSYAATHEEICDQALLHYESLAKECCSWSSVVPRAIKFYKQYGSEAKEKECFYRVEDNGQTTVEETL